MNAEEGQQVTSEPSWVPPLRAGRRPAGAALFGWLDDERAPRLCRITGSSGSGRTHLLSWLATACPRANPHATRRVDVLLPASGLTVRGLTWLFANRLGVAARTPAELVEALTSAGRPRVVLAVSDLDRAGAGQAERVAAELLVPLLQVPGLRLLVESGDGTAVAAVPSAATLDLDDPRWTERQRFDAWCARLGADAEGVYPSPGLARLAVRVEGGVKLDASVPLPERNVAVAEAWWQGVPEDLRPAFRALATAELPVTEETWAALPGSGGPDTVHRAGTLLPPQPDGLSWRLQPQQLADLVADPDGEDPGRQLLDVVRDDPALLAHAHPLPLTTAFEESAGDALAEAWHLAGPALVGLRSPARRAAVLRTWLTGRDPAAADRLAAGSEARWRPRWASWSPAQTLAFGYGSYKGRILAADGDVVRVLDADTGQETATYRLPAVPVSLACASDGHMLVVDRSGNLSVAPDGDSHPVRAARWVAKRLGNRLTFLTPLYIRGSSSWSLGTGDADGGVSFFKMEGSRAVTPGAALHQGAVTALALTLLRKDLFLASGGADGRVRVWMPSREPMEKPLDSRDCPVTAVAAADTAQGFLTVSAWADGAVRLRRLDEADKVVDVNLGSPVRSAVVDAAGHIVLALPEGVVSLRLD